jgi:hypothetical protein
VRINLRSADFIAGSFAADIIGDLPVLNPTFNLNLAGKSRDSGFIISIYTALKALPGHYPIQRSRIHMQIPHALADNS